MKLSQKLHSVLENKSYLKKSRLFLSLTAIGVLGGFFVAYEAIIASDEIVVNTPASGVYWSGPKTISWNTSTCGDTDTVNIMLADTNGAVLTNLAVNVSCKGGSKEWNTATYSGGSYKILVQKNVEGTHQGYTGTFTIDNVAPAITTSTLTSPNGGELWGGAKKTIMWNKDSITDDNLGTNPISLYYSVGNATPVQIATGEANDGSYEWTLPPNVDLSGVTVQIVATDLATNISSDASDATFKIDTIKPVVTVTSLNGGEKLKGGSTQTLAWTVIGNDNTAADAEKVEYTNNGTTWTIIAPTNKAWTVPTDNTGTAKIRVNATDLAGNVGSDESDSAFIIDSTAPKATFVSTSDYFGPITFADRTFRGTVSDVNGSGVAAVKVIIRNSVNPKYWNGSSWQDNEASVVAVLDAGKANWSYVVPSALVLADGVTYSIVPVATDVAGNEDSLATGDLLIYDSSAPSLSITTPVAGTLTKTVSQTVSGTFTESNIQTITVNGTAATLAVGTFSKDISLVEGANTITVIATDKAGNYETKIVSVTLDTHAPAVAVTPSTTNSNKPVLTGTVDDNLAIVKVTVSGKEYTANIANGAWTVSTDVALADGKYNVIAIATDVAGNIGSELTTDELVVDTADPIISAITTPVADAVFTSNASTADVLLTFTASDVTTAATCTYQIDGAGSPSSIGCTGSSIPVSDGRHTITVVVKDGVNKTASATSASFVVNTDKTLTVAGSGADFSSISTAVSKANSGDTISVATGEYTESVVIPTGLTGLTIIGAADKTSIIKPTSVFVPEANGTSAITVKTGSTGITIDGFTFSCDGKDYGIYSIGSGVVIQNNSISGYKRNGIFVKGGVVTINKNIITGSNSADFSGDSIYTRDGATLLITNNTLTGNGFNTPPSETATGLSIHAGDIATITGNTITGNSWGVHIKGAENGSQVNPKIISAENNVIADNTAANVYYENFGFAPLAGYYTMSKNWWGTSAKDTIASKIVTNDIAKPTFTVVPTNYVNFMPWYLSGSTDSNGALNGKLSDSGILTVDDTGTVADFKTIQAAIDAVASAVTANAQINVAAGTYNENIIIPASLTGLKISGNNKSDTFIKSGTGNVVTMNGPATIEGFTIDGLGTGFYGVYEQNVAGVIVQNNTIKSYNRNGVYADKGNISILNNVIVDDGAQTDFSADAIYTRGGLTATITGNDLSGNIFAQIIGTGGGTSAGISIHAGDKVTATGNTIHGNTIGIHAKTGAIVNATGNKIYSNDVGFLYENENNETVSGTFNAINNWWGTAKKSEIAAKIEKAITTGNVTQTLAPTDVVSFDPWYLNLNQDGSFGTLSSTDTTGPVVALSTDDADGIVKAEAGKTVTITANITDATTGIDGTPKITITNGGVSGVAMTADTGNNWTYSWTVPAGDVTATISVEAFDYVGHGVSSTTGITGLIANTTNLIVDNTPPTFTVDDGVATGPVKTDTIKITITEANEIAESKYGFSTNAICDADDTFDNTFASGTEFSIAGNHADFLCVMAKDAAGNISYLPVGKLNTDNAAPVLKEITPIATPGNITTPTYVFTSSEAGTISYSGGCSSSTATASSGDNTIVFVALNDGVYNNCKIKVTDTATNATELDVSDFVVDTTAPAIGSKSPEARVDNLDPVISAKFSDGLGSGIDKSGVVVTVFSESGLVKFTNQDFRITETGVISNTSKIYLVAGGRYKVTLTGLKDLAGNATADDEWSFSVLSTANPSDNDVPTATSNPANGATNVAINVNPVITFSEPMNKSTLTPGNIKLKTYETPSTEIDATLSISGNDNIVTIKPDSALDNSTKYYIMIESGSVSDIAGNKAVSWTKSSNLHVFTTEAPGGTIVNTSINLVPGWNLISLPLIPTNSAIATVLGATLNTATVVDIVQYYKADTGNWISYKPGETNPTLTTMEDGKGYWIYINGSSGVTLSVSGSVKRAASPTIPGYTMFGKKWNLIGFKSLETKTVSEYIGAMNAEDIMLDGNSNNLTENSNIQKGLGYWYYNSGSSDRVINPNK